MVAGASREVLFVLKPIPSEDAAAQFGRMVSLAEQANAKILQATEKASDEWAKAWATATERTVGGRIDAEQRALQKQVATQEKALAAQQREQEKAARSQERAIAQRAKEEERARRQAEKDEERRFKAQVALTEAAAKAERKKWDDEKKARESEVEAARRTQEKTLRDQEKSQRQAESALERQRAMAMQAKMSIAELGEGITRAGRGLATLGIVGEESTEQLVRAFIKIQAAFDIVAGGLKVYKALTVAVESYTKSVELAAVAERALAAARGQSAAAGAASAGTGAGGVAGGAAGGLVGRYLPTIGGGGMLAAGGLIAGAAVLGGRGLYEQYNPKAGGDNSWYGPDTLLGAAMLGGVGGPLSGINPGNADRAGYLESKERTERMTAARERTLAEAEIARGNEADRQEQLARLTALEREQALAAVSSARPDLSAVTRSANERRAEIEGRRPGWDANEQDRGLYSLAVARMERELALQQQQTAAEAALKNARGVYGVELGGYQSAQSEATQARESLGKAMAGGGSLVEVERLREAVAATSKAEEDALSRLSAANENRIRQEETIGEIRRNAAELAVQATQEEMTLRDQMIERDRQRLMTAAERIASMTKAEQEQYGQLLQKARGGGELSAEEFRRLGTLSTEETDKLRREYAEKMSAGFFQQFGVGDIERRRMADNERLREELRVRIEDQRKLSVDVQIDSERIVREVSDEARAIIDQRMNEAISEIKRNLEGSLSNAARQRNEAAQARAAVIR